MCACLECYAMLHNAAELIAFVLVVPTQVVGQLAACIKELTTVLVAWCMICCDLLSVA